MNKNILENNELPAGEPMYSELFGERDSEDIKSVVSEKTKTGIQNVIMAGVLFLNPSGRAEESKLVATVDNKPVPVNVANNNIQPASLSVNTVDHLKKIMEFVDPNELIDYCKKEVRNMNAEEKEIAKQQFNILNLTAMLSPMKKEDIAAWIQNLKMDAWEKEEPYRSKIREIYNSAESSVGVEGGANKVPRVVAVGEKAPLNEMKEERRERLEREKREKERDSVIETTNEYLMNSDKWTSLKKGLSKNDADVKINRTKGTLVFSIDNKGTQGQAFFQQKLFAGKYTLKLDASAGEILLSRKDEKAIILQPGLNNFELKNPVEITINIFPDVMNREIVIRQLSIKLDLQNAGEMAGN